MMMVSLACVPYQNKKKFGVIIVVPLPEKVMYQKTTRNDNNVVWKKNMGT